MKKILIVVGLVAVMGLGFISYNKAHTIWYCKVTQEHDKVVTVLHTVNSGNPTVVLQDIQDK